MTTESNDPFAGLPDHWSDSAKTTYVAIEDEHAGRLSATQEAALFECVAMLAQADTLDAAVRADGLFIDGYRGKRQMHPGLAEARAQRRTALAHLKAFGLRASASTSSTAAAAALASKRWSTR